MRVYTRIRLCSLLYLHFESTFACYLFHLLTETMDYLLLYNNRRALRRQRMIRDRLNPLRFYDAIEVKKIFRFDPESISYITRLVQPALQHATGRSSSLSSYNKSV